MKCKDCKYWERYAGMTVGECAVLCLSISGDTNYLVSDPARPYDGRLHTHRNYGCVEFESASGEKVGLSVLDDMLVRLDRLEGKVEK